MRYFDLEEANKVLESIKPLIYDFIEKRDEIVDIIERISTIEDELEKLYMESVLEEKKQEVNELIYEISSSGAVVKGLNPLLLDFLSKKGNQDIWLCWLEGEEEISHWHGIEEGFMGRKPVELLEEDKKNRDI
jgi:Uncharacterized conserved protein